MCVCLADATWEIQLLQKIRSWCKQKQGLRDMHGHNWSQEAHQWLHGNAVWAFIPLGMLTEMDGHKDGVPNMSSHTSSSLRLKRIISASVSLGSHLLTSPTLIAGNSWNLRAIGSVDWLIWFVLFMSFWMMSLETERCIWGASLVSGFGKRLEEYKTGIESVEDVFL